MLCVTVALGYRWIRSSERARGLPIDATDPVRAIATNPVGSSSGCGASVADIEDLYSRSLIPSTLRAMKASGVVPYTEAERKQKLAELNSMQRIPSFKKVLSEQSATLDRTHTEVLQLNIGLYCNQACSHCHVDSSPKRKEMMTRAVVDKCIDICKRSPTIQVLDITGGAPEMNREFRYLVEQAQTLGLEIIDRCNLTVLCETNQKDLPAFLARNNVHVIASLPCYLESNVDGQRGDEVFIRSIRGLQLLNAVGYGKPRSGLTIDLVYNPTGPYLPPKASALEPDYKSVLEKDYGIVFNKLICITNMPINRYYDHLQNAGELEAYMQTLVSGFNAGTCSNLMCRKYISVKFDGSIYDCDFNQQVELFRNPQNPGKPLTVFDIDTSDDLLRIPIATGKHCFGCTAGEGSS